MARFFLAVIFAALFGTPVSAQMIPFDAGMNQMNRELIKQGMGDINDDTVRSDRTTRATGGSRTSISTGYSVSSAVRSRVESQIINGARNQSAEAATAIETIVEQNDIVSMFDRGMRPFGLRSGNTTDALTAYWIAMWGAATQFEGTPTARQVRAVKNQVANGMGRAAATNLTSDVARQEFAEALIYQTVLIDGAVENAQRTGDNAALDQLGNAAQNHMRGMGIDLRSLRLTDQGFVPGD